jgi:hypothetical protein
MSKNEAEERKRKKEISRTVIILLVILLSPILFLAVYKLYLDHELEKEIAQIRANGYPTNFEELETWYQNGNKFPPPGRSVSHIPDSENAAIDLLAAFKLMVYDVPDPDFSEPEKKPDDDEYEKWYHSKKDNHYIDSENLIVVGTFNEKKFLTTPLPKKITALSKIYLKANEKALEKIQEAIKKTYCRFPKVGDIMQNSGIFPTLTCRRQVARLLQMKSKIAVEEERVEESIDAIEYGIKFAEITSKDPYLITYLVNKACLGIAYNDLKWLLNKKALNKAELQRLSEILSVEPDHNLISLALRTELPFALSKDAESSIGHSLMTRLLLKNSALAEKLKPLGTYIAEYTGLMAREKLLYIEKMHIFLRLTKYDYPKFEQMADEILKKLPKSYCGEIAYIDDIYTMLLTSQARLIATYRNIRTAVAVEQYNLKYGHLPESLNKLIPEFLPALPIDPFDNKPLKYKKCDITIELALKMSEDEIKKIPKPVKKRKKGRNLFADMFNRASKNLPSPSNSVNAWNKPIPGYKLQDVTRPGYMIYSVSDNKTDNGGTPEKNIGRKSDITFTVIREGLK